MPWKVQLPGYRCYHIVTGLGQLTSPGDTGVVLKVATATSHRHADGVMSNTVDTKTRMLLHDAILAHHSKKKEMLDHFPNTWHYYGAASGIWEQVRDAINKAVVTDHEEERLAAFDTGLNEGQIIKETGCSITDIREALETLDLKGETLNKAFPAPPGEPSKVQWQWSLEDSMAIIEHITAKKKADRPWSYRMKMKAELYFTVVANSERKAREMAMNLVRDNDGKPVEVFGIDAPTDELLHFNTKSYYPVLEDVQEAGFDKWKR